MKFGLSKDNWDFLEKTLIQKIKASGNKAFIFGSRAKGSHHPFSDVDILIEDFNLINKSVISDAIEKMEESTFPYKVDVVFLSELAESYRDDVHNSKVEI